MFRAAPCDRVFAGVTGAFTACFDERDINKRGRVAPQLFFAAVRYEESRGNPCGCPQTFCCPDAGQGQALPLQRFCWSPSVEPLQIRNVERPLVLAAATPEFKAAFDVMPRVFC